MFHEIVGRNITFDRQRTKAAWTPHQSGGLSFTERPLSANDPLTLTLEGTGAVELGITSCDPSCLDKVPDSTVSLMEYFFLNDVKIHKRVCEMTITLDETSREVISSYGGGQYKQPISLDQHYYLVADVKYGVVEMKLDNKAEDNRQMHQFSDVHGKNIKRMNNPALATSLIKSPSSLCFYSEPLTSGLQLTILCTPKASQGTIPGRYYLLLRYTSLNPSRFKDRFPHKLDLLQPANNLDCDSEWYQIEQLEKEECVGSPVLLRYEGDSVEIKTSSGKRKRVQIRLGSDDKVWLMFELYGISVILKKSDTKTDYMWDIQEESASSPLMAEPMSPTSPLTHSGSFTVTSSGKGQCLEEGHSENLNRGQGQGNGKNNGGRDNDTVEMSEAIQQNFIKLRENIRVDELIDYLFAAKTITLQEMQELSEMDRTKATRKVLVDILSRRPVNKEAFIMALDKTAQSHLKFYFFPEEEKDSC